MKLKNIVASIFGIIFLAFLITGVLFIVSKIKKEELQILEKLEKNVGEEVPTINDFLIEEKDIEGSIEFFIDKQKYDLKNLSERNNYQVKIIINNQEYISKLEVKDDLAPELELKEHTINEKDSYKIEDFITRCEDNSKATCLYNYETEEMNKIESSGIHEINIIAKDQSGNETIGKTKLIINKKTQAPSQNTVTEPPKKENPRNNISDILPKLERKSEENIPEEINIPLEEIQPSEQDLIDMSNLYVKIMNYQISENIPPLNPNESLYNSAFFRAIEISYLRENPQSSHQKEKLYNIVSNFGYHNYNVSEIMIQSGDLNTTWDTISSNMEYLDLLKRTDFHEIGIWKLTYKNRTAWVIMLGA